MWHVPPLPPHSHPHLHHLSTRPAFQPNLSKNYFKLCITYFKSHNFDSGLFFMCKGYCEKWKCMHYECRTTTRQTILQLQKKPWNEFYNDTFLFRASCKEYLVQFKLIIFVHCLLYCAWNKKLLEKRPRKRIIKNVNKRRTKKLPHFRQCCFPIAEWGLLRLTKAELPNHGRSTKANRSRKA